MARSCYARPYRPAREAAAAREVSPSLRRMFATWRLTVCSLRTRRWAMSWFVRPSATRPRTSSSRSLNSASGPSIGQKRRSRPAELPEHGLRAGALRRRSQLLERRESRLDLAPCPIVAPQRCQRGGEVEPHARGLEASVARSEQVECVLERAPRSVVVAAGCGQRPSEAHRQRGSVASCVRAAISRSCSRASRRAQLAQPANALIATSSPALRSTLRGSGNAAGSDRQARPPLRPGRGRGRVRRGRAT